MTIVIPNSAAGHRIIALAIKLAKQYKKAA